jgi:hypothetical protein
MPITAPDMTAMMWDIIRDPIASKLPSGDVMLHIGGDKMAPLFGIMDFIETWNTFYAKTSGYRVKVATPSEFFTKIEAEAAELPRVGYGIDTNPYNDGALLTYIETKTLARLWETQAIQAEIFGTFGRNIMNLSSMSPSADLFTGWWTNSFLYHHDTVTGTSPLDIASLFLADYRLQAQRADRILWETLRGFASEVASDTSDFSLVVFNSESVPRSEILQTQIPVDLTSLTGYSLSESFDPEQLNITIYDSKRNNSVPVDILAYHPLNTTYGYVDINFYAEVDSIGYRAFPITLEYLPIAVSENPGIQIWESADTITIWNGIYNITWDMAQGGDITGLKFHNEEQLPAGSTIGLSYADTSNDPYSAWIGGIMGQTREGIGSYSLSFAPQFTRLTIHTETLWYRFVITYLIPWNSSRIEISINYENLVENGALATVLLMNWPWSDPAATWTCGEPYGWTDHTNDRWTNNPLPATYWSAIENAQIGLALYDFGIPARDWNMDTNMVSIPLVHQNDPFPGENASDDPSVGGEKFEFYYNEIENYTARIGFEYYAPTWASARIPQAGRQFNFPLRVVGVSNHSISSPSHFTVSRATPQLPAWGSLLQVNNSNFIVGAIKPGELSNGIALRLFGYPGSDPTSTSIMLRWCDNLNTVSFPRTAYFTTALERAYSMEPADSSVSSLSSVLEYDSVQQKLTIPISDIPLRTPRTVFFPFDQDVLAPLVKWDLPVFGMMGIPLQITLHVLDRSAIQITGRYSEDAGQTWLSCPAFQIAEKSPGQWIASTKIIPHAHARLQFQFLVTDASQNLRIIGTIATTFQHNQTTYREGTYLGYNSPQVRIVWPWYIYLGLFGVIGLLGVLFWKRWKHASVEDLSQSQLVTHYFPLIALSGLFLSMFHSNGLIFDRLIHVAVGFYM